MAQQDRVLGPAPGFQPFQVEVEARFLLSSGLENQRILTVHGDDTGDFLLNAVLGGQVQQFF